MARPLCLTFPVAIVLAIVARGSWANADDKEAAIEKEMRALRGVWKLEKQVRNGTAEDGPNITLTTYGTFSMSDKDGVFAAGFFSIDPTQKVKTIDFFYTHGKHKSMWQLGIYKLEGDKLEACSAAFFAGDRPLRLTAESGSNNLLSTYKRHEIKE